MGLGQAVAEKRLSDRGLNPTFRQAFSDAPEGSVFRVEPEPGQKVRRGGIVKVVVSAGPELTDAPAVVGLQIEAATAEITREGLAVGKVERKHAVEPVGIVLDQNPKPGRVRKGDPINLIVSEGPQILDVPGVVGKGYEEASATLTAAGFNAVRENIFSDSAVGTVAGQAPKPGEKAEQGTAIKLLVSKGPQPFAIPDVKGKPCADAKSQLQGAGMTVVIRSSGGQAAECGSNKVLEQEPLAGSNARKGQEATLYVI